jgi:hypothetical protein
MKIILLVTITTLMYSNLATALVTKNCTQEDELTLTAAHEVAKSHMNKAYAILQNPNDDLVKEGLQKYFNLDLQNPKHQKHFKKVKNIMYRLWSKVNRVTYRCASNSGLFCSVGVLAVVPPLHKVQICPSYFARDFDKQVATLIHEWGHRWGFFRLKYIFEKYCHETEGASAKLLVKQPDSYMLFTFYLATDGRGIGCFKLH